MKKTPQVMQLMMELNEERVGVQDALKAWEHWLDSQSGGYYEDGPDIDELLEDDETGEGRALLETVASLANAFQAKLCDLLGVHNPHQPPMSGYGWLDNITITEPIDGGSEGITTTIWYASQYSHREHAYEVTMSKELSITPSAWPMKRKVEDYAQDTEQLVTLIGRGYMALRLMEGGTRYYHNR